MPLGQPVTDPSLLAKINAKLGTPRQDAPVNPVRGVGRSLAQGLTFGFGDEITGALAAGVAKVAGDERPYNEIRADITEAERAGIEQFEKESPGLALGSEIAGAVPTSLLGGRLLVQGAPRMAEAVSANVPGWLKVLGSGAAGGAAFGAGKSEENIIDETLSGAVTGAVVGSVGNVLINKLGRSGVNFLLRKINNSPKSQAKRLVRQALQDSGFTKQEAERKLQELGPDAILADLGGQVRNLARTAQSMPTGPARAQAERFLTARDLRQQESLWSLTQQLTGSQGKTVATLKSLEAAQKKAAGPLYTKAYEARINVTETLQDALSLPEVRTAYRRGRQLVENETGRKLTSKLSQNPTMRQWDYIQRGLRAKASQNMRTGKAEVARTQFILRDRILKEIDGQNPDFARARSTYAQSESTKEALEQGQKFLREDAEVLEDYLGSLTESERQAFTIGATKAIRNEILRPAETRDITRIPLFQSPLVKERLEMALGSERAGRLLGTAKNLAEMRLTKNVMLTRSPTADILAGQGNAQAGSLVGGAAQAASGDILGGLRQAAGALRPSNTLRPDVASQLTNLLLKPNPNLNPLVPRPGRPVSPFPAVPFISGGIGQGLLD